MRINRINKTLLGLLLLVMTVQQALAFLPVCEPSSPQVEAQSEMSAMMMEHHHEMQAEPDAMMHSIDCCQGDVCQAQHCSALSVLAVAEPLSVTVALDAGYHYRFSRTEYHPQSFEPLLRPPIFRT